MDVNATVGLLQLASSIMDQDVVMAAKMQEALGLQNNNVLLSQLYSFQFLLDDVYVTSLPTPQDYANRRDLIRIFNEIAREVYGNNAQCPVVENFGSFLMDMFSAKSDLDLSINFSDQSFESDRIAKTRTLRKFAKKLYALRKIGHVKAVELILSARVPVLKVTDCGSGIECDLSVGNRDGIAKSHIVHMISSIDERFQKLSFMMKAWAKAHDINSSKDGTVNSLSLILLAAFHLQTRETPILPPFSAILKDGMDPATVKLHLPGFLHYGKNNKESLAELFVSLLVKLESVETLWPRGLCASTYEGSWIYKTPNARGYINIEDFTDRSQNTARAVKSKKMKSIYSCIHRSVEQIRSFTAGIIDATQLKNLLFGGVSPVTKNVLPNPSQKKKKRLTQEIPVEGQRSGKQSKHVHNSCNVEAPIPSKSSGVKKIKFRTGRKTDPVTSDTLTSLHGSDKSKETLTPNPVQDKKKCPTQRGSAKGQSPGKLGNHGLNPCSTEAPTPSKTSRVKKKKSKTGKKTVPATSGTPTSVQGSDKSQKILTPNPGQKKKKRLAQEGPAEGQRPGKQGKHGHNPCSTEAPTPSKTSKFEKKKSRNGIKINPVSSNNPASFQEKDKSQVTLAKSCQPLPVLPLGGSGGYRPLGSDIGALNNATQSFQGCLYSTLPNQGSRKIALQSTHVRNPNHVASSFPMNEQPYLSHLPVEPCQRYGPQQTPVGTLSHATPRYPEGHPPYMYDTQSSGGFIPNRTHVETWRHAAPNILQRETLPVSGYGGFNTEKDNFVTLKSAVPSFPLDQPLSHPHYQHSQGYRGFRSESNHVETSRHTPNFQAAPWAPVSDLRVRGPEELVPRMHVETPNYFALRRHSSALANVASGFGPERNATSSFQAPLYTLGSSSSNSMPSHQHYVPTISHREVAGSQWSHDPRQSFSLVPSKIAPNMHLYRS